MATTVAIAVRTGYDPRSQFVSELGVGPHAWIYNDAVIAFGLLEIPFLWSLTGHRGGPLKLVARLLFVVFCAATVFLGLVPTRHHVALGDASFLHVLAFVIGTVSLIGAIFLTAPHFASPGMALFSRGIGVGSGLLLAFPIFVGTERWYMVAGITQRLLLLLLLGWLEVVALRSLLQSIPRTSIWR